MCPADPETWNGMKSRASVGPLFSFLAVLDRIALVGISTEPPCPQLSHRRGRQDCVTVVSGAALWVPGAMRCGPPL